MSGDQSGDGDEVRTAHILVVDDNRLIRSVIAMHFRNHGHEVSEAGNGKEAVELIHHNAFDLVLMDLQMPEMDGITATQLIRSEPAFKSLPIYAFTGQPQSLGANSGLFTDVLVKPMAPAQIEEIVCQSLTESV
jgi:CheY-like chemotaxis protein